MDGEGSRSGNIYVCIVEQLPDKKKAYGITVQLHLKLTPTVKGIKKRSNICNRFKHFGTCACVQYGKEKALKCFLLVFTLTKSILNDLRANSDVTARVPPPEGLMIWAASSFQVRY